MKRSKSLIILALILRLSPLVVASCAIDAPLPQDYYAGTVKIAGGNPPSVPVVTFDKSQLRLDFTAAIDPESGSEVPTYFFYFYNGVPQTYYQTRDIDTKLNSPAVRGFNLNTPANGKHTLILTGFDGFRESAITDQNRIIFEWP